jgi:signal transduction histidine kinase
MWRRILAAPVALKVIGLVVLPLLLISTVGILILQQRAADLLTSAQASPAELAVLTELTKDTLFVFTVGAAVGLGVSLLLTSVLVRPLHGLIQAMRRVRAGDLAIDLPIWADDEIGEVQHEFNAMVQALRDSRQRLLAQQQELAQLNHENSQLLNEVRVKSERLQQLLRRALTAQEAERQRLSRELHDETGQALTSLMLQLKALQEEDDPEVVRDRLNGLRYLTTRTLEEVRRLSIDLRPVALDDLGLVPAIRSYVEDWARRSSIAIAFASNDALGRLPSATEIVLYRAVQEGVTNVVRHSQARHAHIMLDRVGRSVTLMISDDGVGLNLDVTNSNGLGLAGMRERVEMAGGHWQIVSAPAAGTQIMIDLPLPEEGR